MKILKTIAVASLMVCSMVADAEYEEAFYDEYNKYSINRDELKYGDNDEDAGMVQAWIKVEALKNSPHWVESNMKLKKGEYLQQLALFDCNDYSIAVITSKKHSADGSVIWVDDKSSNLNRVSWKPTSDDSSGREITNTACITGVHYHFENLENPDDPNYQQEFERWLRYYPNHALQYLSTIGELE